jgi:hypothetical protein
MAKERSVPFSSKRISRLRIMFKERFFLRFHMTLILIGVFFSGLIASKLLLEVGVRSMLSRYSIAVVFSYIMFFAFIRLWLLYIQQISHKKSSDRRLRDIPYLIDAGEGPSGSQPGFTSSHGGEFAGGGASGDFEDSSCGAGQISATVTHQSTGSSSSSGVGDIDLDEGWIVLVVLGILLALIFGVGAYIVYEAPAILSDAAVEALLATSLIKASKRMDSPIWVGSVFKATWIPFLIVMILSVAIAWISAHYCPGASKLADVFKSL